MNHVVQLITNLFNLNLEKSILQRLLDPSHLGQIEEFLEYLNYYKLPKINNKYIHDKNSYKIQKELRNTSLNN